MPKKLGEVVMIPFNFVGDLAPGETISNPTMTATVYTGVDATPANIISSAPTIVGTTVNQTVSAGVEGVVYGLLCQVETSLGQVLEMSAYCAVITVLP
jgi:pantothenate kinase type III